MHTEVFHWVDMWKKQYPMYFGAVSVLEVGSKDINGSIRGLFDTCSYVGLDIVPGPGVDEVYTATAYMETHKDKKFKTIVSCEMLEHSRSWVQDLLSMYQMLEPRGMLLLTAASINTGEHNKEECGGYYRNVTMHDIESTLPPLLFDAYNISLVISEHKRSINGHDIRFMGIKL